MYTQAGLLKNPEYSKLYLILSTQAGLLKDPLYLIISDTEHSSWFTKGPTLPISVALRFVMILLVLPGWMVNGEKEGSSGALSFSSLGTHTYYS